MGKNQRTVWLQCKDITYTYNPKIEEPSYITALQNLRPNIVENNIEYHINGSGKVIYWEDRENEPPTQEEVNQEYQKQLKEFAEQALYRMRKETLPEPYDLLMMLHEDIKTGNIQSGSFVSIIDSVIEQFPKLKWKWKN